MAGIFSGGSQQRRMFVQMLHFLPKLVFPKVAEG